MLGLRCARASLASFFGMREERGGNSGQRKPGAERPDLFAVSRCRCKDTAKLAMAHNPGSFDLTSSATPVARRSPCAAPPERDARRFNPVFVLAPARSCSSLIAAMLGQHPSLYGFPELRLFRADRVAKLLTEPSPGEGMPMRERAAGLVRALAQLHRGHQTVASVEAAFLWLQERSDWPVSSVFDHLLEIISPRIGVEKSPETSRTDEALDRAANDYPRARFVHLVRHPWSTVESMINAWSGLSYWKVERAAAPQYCLDLWSEQHRRIAAFGDSLASDRFVRVRAEDIVNRPWEFLPELCRWMAIDDGEQSISAMLSPERSCYASPGPVNARGGFDPKFLDAPRMHRVAIPPPRPASSWRFNSVSLQPAINLAYRFGYDAEVAAESSGIHEPGSPPGRPFHRRLGWLRR